MFEQLIESIKKIEFKEDTLTINYKKLNVAELVNLVQAINQNPYIKKLDLSYNEMDDGAIEGLLRIRELDELDLAVNNLSSTDAKYIAQLSVRKLNLSGNPIGDKGAAYFSFKEGLESLYVSECELTAHGVESILQNKNLRIVDLSNNNIYFEDTINFPSDSLIEELDLSQNALDDQNILALSNLKLLTCLNLESNRVSDNFISTISNMRFLETLSLNQNHYITGRCLKEILQNKTIKKLSIVGSALSFIATDDLPENNSLQEIDLASNRLSDECENVLKKLVSIPTLTKIDLSDNKIGEHVLEILIQYKSKLLEEIDISANPGFRKRKRDHRKDISLTDDTEENNNKRVRIKLSSFIQSK